MNQMSTQFSSDPALNYSTDISLDVAAMTRIFEKLHGWRDQLLSFIEGQSGSYATTDKRFLRTFYEFEQF